MVKIPNSIFPAAVSFALLCGGCIPIRYTARPGASGVVLDAHTGAPLGGVAVSVTHVGGDEDAFAYSNLSRSIVGFPSSSSLCGR